MGSIEIKTPTDYQAALDGAVFYPRNDAGVLRLGDRDRLEFLQRQTTNDLRELAEARSRLTVLVSPTARILDVLRVVQQRDEILALTLPGHGENTFHYLQRRIFFNDQVRLADASSEFRQIDLEGPALESLLGELGFSRKPQVDEVLAVDWDGGTLSAIGQLGLTGLGVRLLMPAVAEGGIRAALQAFGALELSHECYEILRVEAGQPASPTELNEAYTPLEVGLDYTVSGSKGCYPGQEVIARQITYDKVTRKLVWLKTQAPVQPGMRLLVDSAPVGEITSAAVSPRFGPIALGMVKRPHYEVETVLQVETEGSTQAVVTELPGREMEP